jgi:hypothetical protein
MGADASQVLGAPQVAGSFVGPKGVTKQMAVSGAGRVVGGVVGSGAAALATGRQGAAAPSFGVLGYVAVTAEEVAIVRGKSGLLKPKVGTDVIARAPRSEIASAQLEPGALTAALKIAFTDGGAWEFEVARVNRKTAEQVVHALGGAVG